MSQATILNEKDGSSCTQAAGDTILRAALRAGLEPIVCVGETLDQRKAGEALSVVTGQVRGSLPEALRSAAFAVAYEPVWAIGTGLTPSREEIEEVHRAIRATLKHLAGLSSVLEDPVLLRIGDFND